MNAAENKRSVIVGIFILLGIVIFVLAVFTLAGKQKKFVKSITLRAVFDDVSGLQTGNNVWYSGVKIGTVKAIDFYGNSQVAITMNIEQEAQKYIRKDAKAKVSSEGFIGNKNVVIYDGNPNVPQVEDGDTLRVEPALSTEEIMETLQVNNKNLAAITQDFKAVSKKIANGEGALGAILTDSLMAENLRAMFISLQATTANTAKVSSSLARFTAKLNTEGSLANEVLTDTVVYSNLKTTMAELMETTRFASEVTENLNKASSKLNSGDNALGLLLNDKETAQQLKETLKNLESSTEKLDENMEALQHNFLFRGYFKKKAKQEAAKEEK